MCALRDHGFVDARVREARAAPLREARDAFARHVLTTHRSPRTADEATKPTASPECTGEWALTYDSQVLRFVEKERFDGTTSGYPGRDVADRFVGCQFFSGGPSAAQPAVQTATQTVAFSQAAPEINAGTVTATLSAYLGGYLTQEDNARVDVTLRNADGGTVGSIPLAPVTAAERANRTTLVRRAATILVPTTARSPQVVLTATRTGGDANDGYADAGSR